jgi:hypothetical protein
VFTDKLPPVVLSREFNAKQVLGRVQILSGCLGMPQGVGAVDGLE